jgi:hypothetical protein
VNLDEQDTAGRVAALTSLAMLVRGPSRTSESESTIGSARALARWVCSTTDLPEVELERRLDAHASLPTDFFTDDAANLLLSLHCGSPDTSFPFFTQGKSDDALVAWAAWRMTFDLAHSSFRSRARRLISSPIRSPIPHRSELVAALTALIPLAWRPASPVLDAACDFTFWGKNAAPECTKAHAQVVQDLRHAGYLEP